jgi:hypothetical protein
MARSRGNTRRIWYIIVAVVALGFAIYYWGYNHGSKADNQIANQAANDDNNPITLAKSIEFGAERLEYTFADTLQLGIAHQGEVLTQRIRLKNTGTEPLVISHHEAHCGCTEVEYSRQPIESGEYRDVTIRYNTRGQSGWQMKLLELYFAQKEYPLKIYIDIEVE